MDEDRARRLAAIESRLRSEEGAEGDPSHASPSSGSASPSASGSTARAPLFGAPRNLPRGWVRPSLRDELERRRELARILNRTVIRDASYANAAGCVETLVKIADNILSSGEEKFRTLKSDNAALRKKVLSVPGGRDFMILMGFHTETRNFIQYFVIDQSQRRMYELELAAGVLRDALPDLQARVAGTNVSKASHKAEEAARVAAAKRAIEDDRQSVRQRTERERLAREARALATQQAELAALERGSEGMDMDEEEEEPSVAGYTMDRRWGYGRRLDEGVEITPEELGLEDLEPQDVKPDIKPDLQDVKPDIQRDVKPDIQPDVKPDIHADAMTDVKPDIKPDIKPDVKMERDD